MNIPESAKQKKTKIISVSLSLETIKRIEIMRKKLNVKNRSTMIDLLVKDYFEKNIMEI